MTDEPIERTERTERQDARDEAQDARGASQDARTVTQDARTVNQDDRAEGQNTREFSQAEWTQQQSLLIAAQTANITQLVTSVDKVAQGLNRRPTVGKTILLIAGFSLLTNIITAGLVGLAVIQLTNGQRDVKTTIQGDLDEFASGSQARGEKIITLTEQLDDCLDTTVEDGDPIGVCAAESQARLTAAVAAVTKDVTCANQKYVLDFIAANPDAGIVPPEPRPECDADGG